MDGGLGRGEGGRGEGMEGEGKEYEKKKIKGGKRSAPIFNPLEFLFLLVFGFFIVFVSAWICFGMA